jgi:hypothetical protein
LQIESLKQTDDGVVKGSSSGCIISAEGLHRGKEMDGSITWVLGVEVEDGSVKVILIFLHRAKIVEVVGRVAHDSHVRLGGAAVHNIHN